MKLTYIPLSNDDIIRVVGTGPISTRGLPPTADPLLELLGPHCYRHKVILNLETADGIDTSGLAWLVRLIARFAQSTGKLGLYGAPPVVRHMLDVLGLAAEVPIATNEQAAIALVLSPKHPVGSDGPSPNGVPESHPPLPPRAFGGLPPPSDAG